jgi:glyoxylase-like metal-dependent hydrolase (beta-lactamase superfamily II)
MRLNGLEIEILCDGVVHVDAGGPFGLVPRGLYSGYLEPAPDNTVPMTLNCLLVRSEGKNILIDTGLGDKLSDQARKQWKLERRSGGLLAELQAAGMSAGDIDIVINTHLHADHCGGNTTLVDGSLAATFPNAEYWVQYIEWADASYPDSRTRGTYFGENFTPLQKEGRLRLLYGDTLVTEGVRCCVAPGHTRAIQVVVLQAEAWKGLFVGDLASYGIQMARAAWLTSYDVLPLENIATKRRWQAWAVENDAWLFFQHDPTTTVARLVSGDDRYELVKMGELG